MIQKRKQAWLDNREWTSVHALSSKEEGEEETTKVHTVRETLECERVRVLREISIISQESDSKVSEGAISHKLML